MRTRPQRDADDWRARFTVTSVPMSFRAHRDAWPSDDWVYYQMLGRLTVTKSGTHQLGMSFATGNAGIGCFADVRLGGVLALQVDVATFFSKRAGGFKGRDELTFTGPVKLAPGAYDAVVTVGCHPGKMASPIPNNRLQAWRDTRLSVVMQAPGEALRLLRSSEVAHVTRDGS